MNEQTAPATWDDFERVALRAGTVRQVEYFAEARKPAYKLWIDFGPYGTKQSSAQLTPLYSQETLRVAKSSAPRDCCPSVSRVSNPRCW